MTTEDFKVVPKFYTTSSLTMIFYKDKIIESVEIYKNYSSFENPIEKAARLAEIKKQTERNEKLVAEGKKAKAIRVKPPVMELKKDKRTTEEINAECERLIKKYIDRIIFAEAYFTGHYDRWVLEDIRKPTLEDAHKIHLLAKNYKNFSEGFSQEVKLYLNLNKL